MDVHAEVAIDGRDRKRLEHVVRYMARPPLALDRLALGDDGQITYRFKKAWRDGTHAVVLSPEDFIARLCALVPPPRFHLMRYLGVLAGHSSLRAEVVPKKPAALPAQLPLLDERDQRDEPTTSVKSATTKTAEPSRHPWPYLLERVFAVRRDGNGSNYLNFSETKVQEVRTVPRPRGAVPELLRDESSGSSNRPPSPGGGPPSPGGGSSRSRPLRHGDDLLRPEFRRDLEASPSLSYKRLRAPPVAHAQMLAVQMPSENTPLPMQ